VSQHKDAIAQIITGQWSNILTHCNSYQLRLLYAIKSCRTAALGGELYLCDKCTKQHVRYNSCGNRHCPRCQNTEKLRWIDARQAQLIDTKYYHVVFTLPHELNELSLANQRIMYSALFKSAWETLNGFGWNKKFLGAQMGATMVLHTWGSNLSYHPHVHCIVPGGGVTLRNKWKTAKGNGKYLFPVDALANVFRAKYLQAIKEAGIHLPTSLKNILKTKGWIVYAKPAFGNKETLIKYLARYAFKSAITHHRIQYFDKDKVIFSYTDYKHKNQKKKMPLSSWEFVRRFILHFLPKNFIRIRHYGILHSSWKNKIFPTVHTERKDYKTIWKEKGINVDKCQNCKNGKLLFMHKIEPKRGPPLKNKKMKNKAHN